MMPKIADIRDQLADREAVRDCLYRYCRAIDRCDFELLASVYWRDSTEDHEPFNEVCRAARLIGNTGPVALHIEAIRVLLDLGGAVHHRQRRQLIPR